MPVYLVKIKNNKCNHLKHNLHLNEILFYAIIIHIFMLFNHLHKTQIVKTEIFMLYLFRLSVCVLYFSAGCWCNTYLTKLLIQKPIN